MFSSDLREDELLGALAHLRGTRTIVALSMADEYVPLALAERNGGERGAYAALGARIAAAAGAELLCLQGADHALSGEASGAEFVAAVVAKLSGLER